MRQKSQTENPQKRKSMKLEKSKLGTRCVPEDSKGGFKGRETYLLEAMNAYYSHRQGYVLPETKVPILKWLIDNKWGARMRLFRKSPALFAPPEDAFGGVTLSEVKKRMSSTTQKGTSLRVEQNCGNRSFSFR